MKNYSINVDLEISQQQIDDTLDAALSACSYWCDLLEVYEKPTEDASAMSEFLTRGGKLKFQINEPFIDGGETEFILTVDKFLQGIADYGHYDFDNMDGGIADCILQQALFGEVVYG